MSRWLISVPVWGERYVDVFCATALPALEKAVLQLPGDARLVIHTDQSNTNTIRRAATEVAMEFKPVPAGARDFDSLSQAHREVLSMGLTDDMIALLTADLVISESSLLYCHKAFTEKNKLLVTCASVRALAEGRIPDTSDGRALYSWAWKNRHPITRACAWPGGKTNDLSRIYFEHEGNVVSRTCLPHPLAVRIDGRSLRFSPTIDSNLMQNFPAHDIQMAMTPDEVAMVELSPRDKDFSVGSASMHDRLKDKSFIITDPLQRWAFGHRLVLVGGSEDCGDQYVYEMIMEEPEKKQ